MNVCSLRLLCVVRQSSLVRADELSRGLLSIMVCVGV
jgi:hypothetical protein